MTINEQRDRARRNPELRVVFDHPLYPAHSCDHPEYWAALPAYIEAADALGTRFCILSIAASCCTTPRKARRRVGEAAGICGVSTAVAARRLMREHLGVEWDDGQPNEGRTE